MKILLYTTRSATRVSQSSKTFSYCIMTNHDAMCKVKKFKHGINSSIYQELPVEKKRRFCVGLNLLCTYVKCKVLPLMIVRCSYKEEHLRTI